MEDQVADFRRLVRETVGASYYRNRPFEAIRYAKTKAQLRRRACSGDEIIAGLGLDVLMARRGLDQWAPALTEMLRSIREVTETDEDQGALALEGATFLYGVVRSMEPDVVIETGIAAGVSSAFLLAALADAGHGRLISIDLPPEQVTLADGAAYDWSRRNVGWAVPQALRDAVGDRHKVILGDVRNVLPRVLDEEGTIDIFIHDDLHTPDHMRWEYDLVWPYLTPGGVLMSDDINHGWTGFADGIGQHSQGVRNVKRFGALRKPGKRSPRERQSSEPRTVAAEPS